MNSLIRFLPKSFLYLLLPFYIVIVWTLFFLLLGMEEHNGGEKDGAFKNYDLIDAVNFQWDSFKKNWMTVLGLVFLWILVISILKSSA